MTDGEGAGDALVARFRVHAGAMTFGMNAAHDAVFIQRQSANASQLARQQHGLIEAALTFTFAMKRNRYDDFRSVERLALLDSQHQLHQTRPDSWCALELQNRGAQGSFVKSAGACGVETILIALAATNSCSSLFAHARERNHAALPTERIVLADQTRSFPADSTGHAVVSRFNTAPANGARPRADQRQRGIVKSAQRVTWRKHAV